MSETTTFDKMRPAPFVEIPVLNKLKRKRTDSLERFPLRAHDNKKLRPEGFDSQLRQNQAVQPQSMRIAPPTSETVSATPSPCHTASPAPPVHNATSPLAELSQVNEGSQQPQPVAGTRQMDVPAEPQPEVSCDALGLTPLQQVIENEFNMQILMKHNELRLIEQELGKCQIALEQLRRCELRGFPGSSQISADVSAGTGAALLPPPGYSRPSHPTPFGVADGPYSKQYRGWLQQDPQFDAVPLSTLQPEGSGRPSRHTASARRPAAHAFTFPGRPAERMQSLPNYPAAPPPKERNQPNVLRRSTDGQLVKLICNNCHRGNFSSIQGFLNHCRIAHKVDYKSHDAAAIDCGQPLDEEEAANLPAETQNTPAVKPTSRPSAKPTPARATPAPTAFNRNLIHPFNTTNGAAMAVNNSRQPLKPRQPVKNVQPLPSPAANSPLTPSNQVPRLSSYFDKHHIGGDLARAAFEAKQKIELGADEDLPSPDISVQNSPLGAFPGSRTFNGGRTASGNEYIPRPPSRKGFRLPQQSLKPRPSPLAPTDGKAVVLKQESSEIPDSPHSHAHSLDLSPHTADSNPGLVSDHEDDDHASASESEDGPTPPAHPGRQLPVEPARRNCADNVEIDVAMEDEPLDAERVFIRRSSIEGHDSVHGASEKFGGR